MARRTAQSGLFGRTDTANEQMPGRPDLLSILARLIVILALGLLWAMPAFQRWAITDPGLRIYDGAAPIEPDVMLELAGPGLIALSVWLVSTPVPRLVAVLALGGLLVWLVELCVAAGHLIHQRRIVRRVGTSYYAVRPLRPQSRKGAATDPDPVALWQGFHAALRLGTTMSDPWVACTLSGLPDQPIRLGMQIASATPATDAPPRSSLAVMRRDAHPAATAYYERIRAVGAPPASDAGAPARASIARAITNMLVGQDAECLVEARPDPLQSALQPGMVVCWQELRLTKPPHLLIASPDAMSGDSLGPLVAALRTPGGVACTEMQVIVRPRPDTDLRTPWRVFARRRLVGLRRKHLPGTHDQAKRLEAKLEREAYDVSVRLVAVAATAGDVPAAHQTLHELTGAFGQFQTRSAVGRQMFRPAGLRSIKTVQVPSAAPRPTLAHGLLLLLSCCLMVGSGVLALFSSLPVVCIAVVLATFGCLIAGHVLLRPTALARVIKRTPRIRPLPTLLAPRQLWAAPMILSSGEVAGLWHLPSVALKTLVDWLPNRYLPAQPHAFVGETAETIIIGTARRSDGTEAPVGLSLRALRQVMHVTAGMGAGKTRLAANIAYQCILHQHATMIGCGKGDDFGSSLAVLARYYLTLADEERLVILDVLDAEWPIGLNPLYGIKTNQAGGMTQAIGLILAVFARLDPETWSRSQGMQQYAQMGAALVAETVTNPTMANLKQAIQDESYRQTLLPTCTNIEVRNFWEVTFPQTGEQQKTSRDALMRRLDNLMVDETTRYLLTQPVPTVDVLACMETKRIVVAPLPHRTLGGIAEFVGMLIVQAIMRAAFRRPGSDTTRATVPLILDELQIFIGKGDNNDIQDAITQLRGFGIGGIYLHQSLTQLGTLKDEMLNNSANRVVLRTQEPDASAYARQFPTTDLTAADIVGQHFNEHQYAVFAGGDAPAEICSIRPLPWPTPFDMEGTIPPYHGPDWQTLTPSAPCDAVEQDGLTLEALICQMIYGDIDMPHVAAQLALLPDDEWDYLISRWDAIRAYQRRYILANPGCVPFDHSITHPDQVQERQAQSSDRRMRRQQWLSRLETRTPRVLAAATYQRQRWMLDPNAAPESTRPRKAEKRGQAKQARQQYDPAPGAYRTTDLSPALVVAPPYAVPDTEDEAVLVATAVQSARGPIEAVFRSLEQSADQRHIRRRPASQTGTSELLDYSALDGEKR